MESVLKELLKNYIKEQEFINTDNILIAIKEMVFDIFFDAIQKKKSKEKVIITLRYII